MTCDYRLYNVESNGHFGDYEVYEDVRAVHAEMNRVAKEYEKKGYTVRIDNKTVRVWDNIYAWPIVYKMWDRNFNVG